MIFSVSLTVISGASCIFGAGESARNRKKSSIPASAYPERTIRYESNTLQPLDCSNFASQPPASAPVAVAKEPERLYQAKVCVRFWSGMSWVRAACSMERKGPISLPLGLMIQNLKASSKRLS